jgi:hypothetical protein
LPDQRAAFLEMLAAKLNDRNEIGDGQLHKICAEIQRQVFTPPAFDRDSGGKWNGKAVRRARSV